jgi:hypothetical protein
MTTTYPTNPAKDFNDWIAHINRQSIFGRIAYDGMLSDPEKTIQMIRDQYLDNPIMIRQIIGDELLKQIL